MSLDFRHTTPEDVVGKVLRRAEVAKVRLLSDPLLLRLGIRDNWLIQYLLDGQKAT